MTVNLSACGKQNEEIVLTEEQLNCNHEWAKIDWDYNGSDIIYDIYCPKCKLEKKVKSKEWKKIQADMEYEKENK